MYTVQRGDTLYAIAQHFNSSVDEITDHNDIDDVRALPVGVTLRIPYRGDNLDASSRASLARPKLKPDVGSMKTVKLTTARKYVGTMRWPVPGARAGSLFGSRWSSFHEGLDLAASEGTPVYAAHDGMVVYSDDGLRGYGNLVVIRGDGILTVYGHNRRNRVSKGQRVDKGDRIADVGQTGHATGPHLHFETRVKTADGKYTAVDPMVFFP